VSAVASPALAAHSFAPAAEAIVFRARLPDGADTTVYARPYPLDSVEPRVVRLARPEPLAAWCARGGVEHAIVGGFFVRDGGEPLGELRTGGVRRRSVPFLAPWGRLRSCVHVDGGALAIATRPELPAQPRGDLLQAGPLLVRDGRSLVRGESDLEGFSAGAAQFDSDITLGRHPRAALGLAGPVAWAVVCDGRAPDEAGLTLGELADLLVRLGARTAINLDGGGSTTLVSGGRLVNSPRELEGDPIPGGRPVATALIFEEHGEGLRRLERG
jgi:hypothetical protein